MLKNHNNSNSEQAVDDISTQEFSLGSMDYSCDNESIKTISTKNVCQLQLAKSRSDTSCSLVAETQDNANDSIDEVGNPTSTHNIIQGKDNKLPVSRCSTTYTGGSHGLLQPVTPW